MSLMMMLALRGGQQKSVTITSSQTWVAPTSKIDVIGRGAAGTPYNPGTTRDETLIQVYLYRRDGKPTEVVTSSGAGWGYGTGNGVNYCEPEVAETDSTVYYKSQKCYVYRTLVIGETAATTGDSATGFGKTFPGGYGGAATPVNYTGVAVTQGAGYPLTVPAGGSITITWVE